MTYRHRAGLSLMSAALVALAVACGGTIPVDEEATALNPDQLNPVLAESTTTTTVPANARLRRIFLIDDSNSDPVMFSCPLSVEAQPTIDDDAYATLDKLVRTEPGAASSTCGSRLTNFVPADLRVNGTTVEGGTVTVDITGLAAVESSAQRQAVAQVVFTLTDLAGIERVIFLNDGRPISVPTGTGTSAVGAAVAQTDFPEYSSTVQPTASVVQPPEGEQPADPAADPAVGEAPAGVEPAAGT